MTKERNIKDMAPIFTGRITAITSIGCERATPPSSLNCPNWIFEADIDYKMYEVLETLQEGVEEYPYICVFGIRTLWGSN